MPRWDPPAEEGYRLHENQNDGFLRFIKPVSAQGPWRLVAPEDQDAIVRREQDRLEYYNKFMGSLVGRSEERRCRERV